MEQNYEYIYEDVLFLVNGKLCQIFFDELIFFYYLFKKYEYIIDYNINKSKLKTNLKSYIELWLNKLNINEYDLKIIGKINDYITSDNIDYYILIDEKNKIINFDKNIIEKDDYNKIFNNIINENNLWDKIDYYDDETDYEAILCTLELYNDVENIEEANDILYEDDKKEYERALNIYNNYHNKLYIKNKIKDTEFKISYLRKVVNKYYYDNKDKQKIYLQKLCTQYCRLYKYTNNNFEKIKFNLYAYNVINNEKRIDDTYKDYDKRITLKTYNNKYYIEIFGSRVYRYVDDGHDYWISSEKDPVFKLEKKYDDYDISEQNAKKMLLKIFNDVFNDVLFDDVSEDEEQINNSDDENEDNFIEDDYNEFN